MQSIQHYPIRKQGLAASHSKT